MAEIADFFRVTTQIQTGGLVSRIFGRGLMLTIDDSIAAGGPGKAQFFPDLDALMEVFAGDSQPVAAARRWFSYDPAPQGLYVGRWASVDISTTLRGATPAAVADLKDAAAAFSIDGHDVSADTSGAGVTTYANIAALLQTALQAVTGYSGATLTYDNGAFLITLADASQITGGALAAPSAGTDISALLGMAASSSPTYHRGHDAEAPSEAIAEILRLQAQRPVYIGYDAGVPAAYGTNGNTFDDVTAYCNANNLLCADTDTSDAARTVGDSTSKLHRAFDAQQGRTLVCVADAGGESHMAALAALSSINWDNAASIITLFGRTFPNVPTVSLTPTQEDEVNRKRGNYYTNVGGSPTFIEGYMARSGYWADAVAFNMWLQNRIELGIWGAARASRRLTVAIMFDAITAAMRAGVRNGGIEPGRTVSPTTKADIIRTTGNQDFDGVLQAGFFVHIGQLADQAQVDIDARRSPPVKIWAAGSPAIHRGNVDLIFQN